MSPPTASIEAERLRASDAGSVPVEYAMIAATVVFAILSFLQVIGGGIALGFPPLIDALPSAGS